MQDKLHVCCSCIFDSLSCVYRKSYIGTMWWACGIGKAVNSIAAVVHQVWVLGITGFPFEYSFSKFGVQFYVLTDFNLCSWNMCVFHNKKPSSRGEGCHGIPAEPCGFYMSVVIHFFVTSCSWLMVLHIFCVY